MRRISFLGLVGCFLVVVLCAPVMSLAASTPTDEPCKDVQEMDDKNLCRALKLDNTRSQEEKKNRYQNKDHSTYYCSLIRNRDKQTFCYAVVNKNKTQCGLIVDSKLEQDCNSRF